MEECRQLTIFGEEIPQEPPEVRRDRDGKFLPGSSGNPSGKQKPTWEEREALEEIKKLAPGVNIIKISGVDCSAFLMAWE